ncbi:MAG: hypothetical protein PHD98_02195 [Bacilli bacterium]|jgi:hypothetical protein|nr:hypothetical protein [Bacilli bacterium]MDD4005959.1 hypothetical protein [Bacilli bacterium]
MKPFEKQIVGAGLLYAKEAKKQIIISVSFVIVFSAIVIILKQYLLLLFLPLFIGLYFFFLSYRYGTLKMQKTYLSQKEFVKLFTYFEIYLRNGYNIYQSLEALIPFASTNIRGHLETLIAQIDEDKSVLPFLKFGKRFASYSIEQAMICVFQMVEQGNDNLRILQFQSIFSKIADQHYVDEVEKVKKGFDSLMVLPLLGAGLITMMITLGVVSVIGDIISGI